MRFFKRTLRILLVLAFWLGLWAFASWRVGLPLLFPTPGAVLECLWGLMQTSEFYLVLLTSLWNVLYGIIIAVALGMLLAALTHRVKFLRELLLPLMTVIKATPVASFIFFALIWIGSVRVPSFITVLIVLPIVWTNLDEGLRKTDPMLIELTRAYKMPVWKGLRVLTIPSVKPYFISACRSSVGLGWKAGVAAEIIARPRGSIGTMMSDAKQYLETDDLFAWTLAVILLSLIIEAILSTLLGRIAADRRERRTENDDA